MTNISAQGKVKKKINTNYVKERTVDMVIGHVIRQFLVSPYVQESTNLLIENQLEGIKHPPMFKFHSGK